MKNAGIKVKICGLTNSADVQVALELDPWALGFIFYKKSPRFVAPQTVGEILSRNSGRFDDKSIASLPLTVGVFVNAPLSEIKEVVGVSKVRAVQLHGDESPSFCTEVKEALPEITLIKATRPQTHDEIMSFTKFKNCDYLLIDVFSKEARGGTGKLAAWDLAATYVQENKNPPLLLSGGLSEANLSAALAAVKPFGFDLSSSLEVSPGVKSHEKMRSLMALARRLNSGATK